MLKLKFKNIQFEQEDPKTVCILNCEIYKTESKQVLLEFTIKAETSVLEGDTFDSTKGKRIAESKARKLAYGKAESFYTFDDFIKLVRQAQEIQTFAANMHFYKLREKEHFNILKV